MNPANAFIGHAHQPTAAEVTNALGSSAKLWTELVDYLAIADGVTTREWKSISPKYGWALRLKLKKRTIVHLSPCKDCFRAAFILGDKAVRAAQHCNLPKPVVKAIETAPRYTEGTGVRLTVHEAKDLLPIFKLAEVKLAN